MTDEHKKRRGRPRTRPGNPKNSYDATQPDAAKEFHEQAFVEHFCQLWKVAAAARAAGYKDRATASKLLRKPSVIAKLREKLKDIEVTSEEARRESAGRYGRGPVRHRTGKKRRRQGHRRARKAESGSGQT